MRLKKLPRPAIAKASNTIELLSWLLLV